MKFYRKLKDAILLYGELYEIKGYIYRDESKRNLYVRIFDAITAFEDKVLNGTLDYDKWFESALPLQKEALIK